MSYFGKNTVYIIIPIADLTIDMKNDMKIYFCTSPSQIRMNISRDLCLLKTKIPVTSLYNAYTWYNESSIKNQLTADGFEEL